MARMPAPSSARSQALLQAEASKPAASAQHIALEFTSTDSAASLQLTPPSRKGMVNTGSTASQGHRPQPVGQSFGHDDVRPLQRRQEEQPQGPFPALPADAIRRQHRHQDPDRPEERGMEAPEQRRPRPGANPIFKPNSKLTSNSAVTPSTRR